MYRPVGHPARARGEVTGGPRAMVPVRRWWRTGARHYPRRSGGGGMEWLRSGTGASRGARGLAWVLASALLVAAVVLALRVLDARRGVRAAHPPVEGRLTAPGLEGRVEVVRDRRGIPHVRALHDADAWLALGFVHAQDRLAQMLWLRRVAQGRSAEWAGESGLAADRLARTAGLAVRAALDAERASPRARAVLASYAAGVNVRLARLAEGLEEPPLALGEPLAGVEPWAPADSLALLKLHAFAQDATLEESLVLAELIQRFGGFGARPFFPPGLGFDAVPPEPDPTLARGLPSPAPALRAAAGLAGRSIGSTAFAVSAGLASREGALLAADLHFEARAPANVYEAHLHAGELDVAGATLPGIPGFWTGFTPDVAWASTRVPVVVADLFVETLHPDDPRRYKDGSRWRSLAMREETLRVRGGAEETLAVAETVRGPLVHTLVDSGRPLALRWPGALPGTGVEALVQMAYADGAEALREALRQHHEPVLEVVYADRRGHGGSQVAGWIPKRALPAGGVPVPARNPAFLWKDPLAYDDLPRRSLGPGSAWVVAADGPVGGRPAGAGMEVLWRPGERARRVNALLREAALAGGVDVTTLVAVQRDVTSGGASELIEAALRLAGDLSGLRREARDVAQTLEAWDRRSATDSLGAAVYHVFLTRLVRALFEASLGPELLERYLALRGVSPGVLVQGVLEAAARGEPDPNGWADPEAVRAAVRRSLGDAWISLSVELSANRERWTWGNLHRVRFAPLARTAPALGELGPFAYGGDASSVQVAEYRGVDSLDARVVATYRFVANASDLDQALTSLTPGQSEHPAHRHATDGLARWLEGRPSLLSTSPPVIEDGEVARLTLEPPP